jgi:hypothetical protein
MSETLIRRLQERIRSEPTVDMEVWPPIRPRPPVSEQALAEAEARLGFALPSLVRALYTQVADGGYGPGYGVVQLHILVESRLGMDEEDEAEWVCPERLVEFVGWGCNYFSGIDCSHPACPVFFYNNDEAVEGATLTDCLLPEAYSLEEWLSAWLDGEDLWERGSRLGLHGLHG